MLNWRSTLPDLEDAGDFARDQLRSVSKSAKEVSSQLESWANDGYGAVRDAARSDAAFWGAITVGMGACIGGMYALWTTATKSPQGKRMVRSMAKNIRMSRKRVARAVAAARAQR